jgi:hypothetical protein
VSSLAKNRHFTHVDDPPRSNCRAILLGGGPAHYSPHGEDSQPEVTCQSGPSGPRKRSEKRLAFRPRVTSRYPQPDVTHVLDLHSPQSSSWPRR